MNKVLLIGRLTRDPEIRWTQGQESMCVAKFTLAVDRRTKKEGEQSADFISCTAFKKPAEFIEKYIKKGTKIALEGRWQTGSYTNKEGAKIYTNDCIVEQVEFAESKASENKQETAPTAPQDDGFMNIPDEVDEIPFPMG